MSAGLNQNTQRSLFFTGAERISMFDTHSPDLHYPDLAHAVHELPPNHESHYAVYVRKVSCLYSYC